MFCSHNVVKKKDKVLNNNKDNKVPLDMQQLIG